MTGQYLPRAARPIQYRRGRTTTRQLRVVVVLRAAQRPGERAGHTPGASIASEALSSRMLPGTWVGDEASAYPLCSSPGIASKRTPQQLRSAVGAHRNRASCAVLSPASPRVAPHLLRATRNSTSSRYTANVPKKPSFFTPKRSLTGCPA